MKTKPHSLIGQFLAFVLFALACCSTAVALHGEEQFKYTPKDYSVLPPPPEVAAIIEHNEISVNHNSGQPDISFTLFSIASGSLEVPVKLSYQSGGIRGDQRADNAGVGWTVLSNAVIGRHVVGLPDDQLPTANHPQICGLIEQQRRMSETARADYDFRQFLIERTMEVDPTEARSIENEHQEYNCYQRYILGYTDVANDIATLSGLGLSATLAYNRGKLVMTSDRPLKIQQSAPFTDDFTVTDAAGVSYVFGCQERCRKVYKHGNPLLYITEDTLRYTSAWHLTAMRNISGDSISFSYIEGSERWWGSSSSTKSYCLNRQLEPMVEHLSTSSTKIHSYPKLLSSIQGKGVRADFFYRSKESTDRSTFFLIDSIKYVYTGNPPAAITYAFIYDDNDMLLGIERNGERIYIFDYYFNDGGPGSDFGGYCNGRGLGTGLPPCPVDPQDDGDDRSVSTEHAIHRSLKSIIYPTGGSDELIWESHTVSNINGLPVPASPELTYDLHTTRTDTLCGLTPSHLRKTVIDNYRVAPSTLCYIDLKKFLQFDPSILYNSDFYAHHSFSDNYAAPYPRVVFIDKEHNDRIVHNFFIDSQTLQKCDLTADGFLQVALAPGVYRIELRDPTSIALHNFSLDSMFGNTENGGMIYLEQRSPLSQNFNSECVIWPGLRIRQIVSDFNDGSPQVRKHFYYSGGPDPDKTTGMALSFPEHTHTTYLITQKWVPGVDLGAPIFDLFSKIYVTTPYGFKTSYCSSPAVEYSEVGVKYSLEDPNQPTDLHMDVQWYQYTTADQTSSRDILLITPFNTSQPASSKVLTSKAFRRGLLTRQTMAHTSRQTPATFYEYNIFETEPADTLTTDAYLVTNYTTWSQTGSHERLKNLYSIGKFCLIPYNRTLRSQTFVDNGFRTSTSYSYFYDNYTDHLDRELVRSKTDTLPDGRIKRTFYTYVKKGNQYLPLKECEFTVENNYITSGTLNVYDNSYRLIGKMDLSVRQKAFITSMIIDKSASDQLKSYFANPTYKYIYDGDRLVEIDYNDKILVSYLWGYENMYPVIEAAGISYTKLKAASTADPLNSLDALRAAFPGKSIKAVRWSPLIGPVEISDSNGILTRYSYDSTGRLSTVRDTNNALIEQHYYVY